LAVNKSGDDAADVGVDHRLALSERERAHGASGVGTDTRQRQQSIDVVGHAAAEAVTHRDRAQVSKAVLKVGGGRESGLAPPGNVT
jgi:hypothetical protein